MRRNLMETDMFDKQYPRRRDVREFADTLFVALSNNMGDGVWNREWLSEVRDLMRHNGNTFEEAVLIIEQANEEAKNISLHEMAQNLGFES
jgi:hypothetical protein